MTDFQLSFKLECHPDEEWHPANGPQFGGVSLPQACTLCSNRKLEALFPATRFV